MTAKRSIRIAISQFPVTGDVRRNGRHIRRLIAAAAEQGADILQTCELALPGYGGIDVKSSSDYDWRALTEETAAIQNCARRHKLWLTLGSSHYLGPAGKPTNCLYLINGQGDIVDRYDKRFCTGGDLANYTSGDHGVTFDFKGFRLGLAICYDGCFPHLYRAYEEQGVEIMLHSFYNAGGGGPSCLDEIGPAWVQVRAADHEMWVLASNSSRRHSCWPSMIAAPDGTVPVRIGRHATGAATYEVTGVGPAKPGFGWLHMAGCRPLYRKGLLHNGRPSRCERALNRKSLPAGPTRK